MEVDNKQSNAGSDSGLNPQRLGSRKVSWLSARVDSLNVEAGRIDRRHSHSKDSWARTLSLAFQSIGVIYGDIGTSPLYVYSSTFTDGIKHNDDILGVLSLIIYTIALIPMIKYVFIVLWANDNGDGGTFALYSKICKYVPKVSQIPNQQPEDMELSNYRIEPSSMELKRAAKIKEFIENSGISKQILFLLTILGTSMVMGDGVLTPSISVLSAIGGIPHLHTDAIVWISVAVLVILFSVQRFGTDKVGFSFAPIVSVWFLFISGIGLYNLFKNDIGVLKAFYPKYIVDYFKRNGKQGWVSLGTEAMFADLGHFNVRAIQISFSTMVFPALLMAYSGQAAYLRKHPGDVLNTFYASIPHRVYWPMFVVAVAAAIIASQAMISGAYAIISQSLALGCFPRVKVVHTSAKYEGQVYIPEINYVLMIGCVLVTLGFKTTAKIGNAYGIAVCIVMVITTSMLTLIMLMIWKTSIWKVALFVFFFGVIELVYLSSVLEKFTQGGFLPLLLAFFLMTIMTIWHYVHKHKYMYEACNKVSVDEVQKIVQNPKINRVPGIGLFYSELVQGIPPIFRHFVNNIPSINMVLIFVSIKKIPISRVLSEERFLFRRIRPKEHRMFRCVVRYGYNDVNESPATFERQLVDNLIDFIKEEHAMLRGTSIHVYDDELLRSSILVPDAPTAGGSDRHAIHAEKSLQQNTGPTGLSSGSINTENVTNSHSEQVAEEEFVRNVMDEGFVYLLGESKVIAKNDSSFFKSFVVNHVYDFLKKNFRQGEEVLAIPHSRLVRVGMTYEI
ncbi:Potassium transporter 5-like protein [Drosera capensis]